MAETVVWDDAHVEWGAFDLVLVRSTWDYVPKLRTFRSWIDHTGGMTRLVNPAATLQWNLHKGYLLELGLCGVPIVPTVLLGAHERADWETLAAGHDELVLKPAESAGSFATIRIAAADHAGAAAHRAAHHARDFLVQPFLPSVVDRGETNLVFLGGAFSHAVRKGARWSGDAEQSRGLVEPEPDELAVAVQVLDAVRGLGHGTPAYARIDLAIGPCGRPLLMELELVEPSLFLDRSVGSADRLLDALVVDGG
jgi:glutathione synthase/RimK-type ligase-like ATP-grasp enzyme